MSEDEEDELHLLIIQQRELIQTLSLALVWLAFTLAVCVGYMMLRWGLS